MDCALHTHADRLCYMAGVNLIQTLVLLPSVLYVFHPPSPLLSIPPPTPLPFFPPVYQVVYLLLPHVIPPPLLPLTALPTPLPLLRALIARGCQHFSQSPGNVLPHPAIYSQSCSWSDEFAMQFTFLACSFICLLGECTLTIKIPLCHSTDSQHRVLKPYKPISAQHTPLIIFKVAKD